MPMLSMMAGGESEVHTNVESKQGGKRQRRLIPPAWSPAERERAKRAGGEREDGEVRRVKGAFGVRVCVKFLSVALESRCLLARFPFLPCGFSVVAASDARAVFVV